jgi:hypothetical protein
MLYLSHIIFHLTGIVLRRAESCTNRQALLKAAFAEDIVKICPSLILRGKRNCSAKGWYEGLGLSLSMSVQNTFGDLRMFNFFTLQILQIVQQFLQTSATTFC